MVLYSQSKIAHHQQAVSNLKDKNAYLFISNDYRYHEMNIDNKSSSYSDSYISHRDEHHHSFDIEEEISDHRFRL